MAMMYGFIYFFWMLMLKLVFDSYVCCIIEVIIVSGKQLVYVLCEQLVFIV